MIILDTNVVSELMRAAPDPAVVAWVSEHAPGTLHTTSITVAEILLGIELMAAGKKREAMRAAAEGVFADVFADRVLAFGGNAAAAFADLVASRRRVGRPIAALDAQIAAICSTEKALLATRNQADFDGCGVKVANPWGAIRADKATEATGPGYTSKRPAGRTVKRPKPVGRAHG